MKSGYSCTNLKQINYRKLLNLLFKHISPTHGPNIAIIIPIFSYDFLMNFQFWEMLNIGLSDVWKSQPDPCRVQIGMYGMLELPGAQNGA